MKNHGPKPRRPRAAVVASLFSTAFFLVAPGVHSQGTLYVSNVNRPAAGSLPVASEAWVASWFQTGPSPGGYALNSISLSMSEGSGNPSGFAVMFWDFRFGQSLVDLVGSDPSTSGVFTYTAPTFVLAPSTVYWFAVTSTTPAATGAFHWNYAASGSGASTTGGWSSAIVIKPQATVGAGAGLSNWAWSNLR